MRPVSRVVRVESAESTMDLLHVLAANGAEAGTIVVAREQTDGRGSRGRSWRSPPGGLWLSVLYLPTSGTGVELLGLRVGLAAAEAIEALAPGLPLGLKWPNDLMLGARKVGGVLCEARWQGESPAWVVAGVGINVANAIPDELAGMATSLSERLPGLTPEQAEPEVARALRAVSTTRERLSDTELRDLRRRDWLLGRRLSAPVAGTAAGVSPDGALLVRADDGSVVAVTVGTVELADHTFTP
jgi:BirA family transcriptional regulator, biotin operon repressor / biotin---[acetyl-CoA-carboxylase] ligase